MFSRGCLRLPSRIEPAKDGETGDGGDLSEEGASPGERACRQGELWTRDNQSATFVLSDNIDMRQMLSHHSCQLYNEYRGMYRVLREFQTLGNKPDLNSCRSWRKIRGSFKAFVYEYTTTTTTTTIRTYSHFKS